MNPIVGGTHALSASPTELMSAPQAAIYLGTTERTLAVWRSTRRYPLKFVKIGRCVRYRRADLDAFIADRTRG
jgi:excisionase family DNA binding protein